MRRTPTSAMSKPNFLYAPAFDVMWLVVRTCDVMHCGCVMWCIGMCCEVNGEGMTAKPLRGAFHWSAKLGMQNAQKLRRTHVTVLRLRTTEHYSHETSSTFRRATYGMQNAMELRQLDVGCRPRRLPGVPGPMRRSGSTDARELGLVAGTQLAAGAALPHSVAKVVPVPSASAVTLGKSASERLSYSTGSYSLYSQLLYCQLLSLSATYSQLLY